MQEENCEVDFPFDGDSLRAVAILVSGMQMLIGTRLLKNHPLVIDFPRRRVTLERTNG